MVLKPVVKHARRKPLGGRRCYRFGSLGVFHVCAHDCVFQVPGCPSPLQALVFSKLGCFYNFLIYYSRFSHSQVPTPHSQMYYSGSSNPNPQLSHPKTSNFEFPAPKYIALELPTLPPEKLWSSQVAHSNSIKKFLIRPNKKTIDKIWD